MTGMPTPAGPRESDPCINGGRKHAWRSLGLDISRRDTALVTARRCVWCQIEQDKPYGAGGRRSWRTVPADVPSELAERTKHDPDD